MRETHGNHIGNHGNHIEYLSHALCSFRNITEKSLCAKRLARSLVDLMHLTVRDLMLTEINPQRREEIRDTQSILGSCPRKNWHLIHTHV